jgi:neutral/alkaline ceramidase-like enzyme
VGTTRDRKRLFRLGLVAGALAALAWVWTDHCRAPSGLVDVARLPEVKGQGPLEAGAGRARIQVALPVTRAGYGPMEPRAERQVAPLSARALAVGAGGVKVVVVTLDLLTLPESLAAEVSREVEGMGAGAVLVAATHAHSSVGGYDDRKEMGFTGVGWPDAAVRGAVVGAAKEAAKQALGSMARARVAVGSAEAADLVASRAEGEVADGRLTRVRVESEAGRRVAEVLVFAAHPTLQPRHDGVLSPDYPAAVSEALEADGGGVVLTLVGSGGNAMAQVPGEPAPEARVEAFARAVAGRAGQVALGPAVGEGVVRAAAAVMPLPHPDASRLVGGWLRTPAENALCGMAREAKVERWTLGPVTLVAVPGEITAPAGARVEQAARAGRVVSLANGYVGYVDTEEQVHARAGESRRQYFPAELLGALERAAALTAE